jgi:hypothetical protein
MGFFAILDYLWGFFLVAYVVVLIIWLVVMNKALDNVSHDLRRMEPNSVWLCFIPVFGFVWQFFVVNAVSEGLAKELIARNMFPKEEKPAVGFGLTASILMSCWIIPYAGVCIAIIGLVLLVVHITKISEYITVLQQSGRWEMHYEARMAAIRGQMNGSWQQQHPYPGYQTPAGYVAPPQPLPKVQTPPPGYYNPAEINQYRPKKDKPQNPFS